MADSKSLGGALPVGMISDCCELFQLSLKACSVPFASSSDRVGSANAPGDELVRQGQRAHDYLLIYRKIGTISASLIATCHISLITYHSLVRAVSSVVERLVYTPLLGAFSAVRVFPRKHRKMGVLRGKTVSEVRYPKCIPGYR